MGINRRFLLVLYNYFQKEVLQLSMSFIFYINNGFANIATIEQFQGYYQNISGYYPNNEQIYSHNSFPQTWTQSEPFPQNDHKTALPTQLPRDDTPEGQQKEQAPAVRPKRRMEKTLEKEILSAKKNSQSNIINQFYSFFSSREKSERVVERCALLMGKAPSEVEKILSIFYSTMRLINLKRGRKYVNVAMFLKFFTPEQLGEYLSEMREKLEQLDYLSVDELCEIFRRCAKYFLKEVSIHAILTSKRISVVSKEEHLKKRRKILRTVMGN